MVKFRNSLLMKVILLVMIVVILPSIVSNVIAYRQNYAMVEQQIVDWNKSMMGIGMEETVEYFGKIEQAPTLLFEDIDLIRLFGREDAYTEMERYKVKSFGQTIYEQNHNIFRIAMRCRNGETIDEIYTEKAFELKKYDQYKATDNDAIQSIRDDDDHPAGIIYHTTLENVPSYDPVVDLQIYVAIDDLSQMARRICGEYQDHIVMLYLGETEEQLIFSSQPYKEAVYDAEVLSRRNYVKGTLDGEDGMFFLKSQVYKGSHVRLVKFVQNHYFRDSADKVVGSAVLVQTCLLILAVAFLLLMFNLFISPVRRMVSNMSSVDQNTTFEYKVKTRRKDELGVLEDQYQGLIKRLDELINKNYRSQLEATKSQFRMLQSQINPHFLYNMLQYISTTALKNQCPEVSGQLTQLGELFRYTMNNADEMVSLRQELDHIENYITLQEGRFGGRLHFAVSCPETVKETRVPKMILQPLVENSIKHGIDKVNGSGHIMISIIEREGGCCIRVIDNGIGMSHSQISRIEESYKSYETAAHAQQGIGLLNVLLRCKIYSDGKFRWTLKSIPEVETIVELIFEGTDDGREGEVNEGNYRR